MKTPVQTLDLRTTKCPLNFVKAKLALEKLTMGDCLEISILAESQSSLNIPQSLRQEGHVIVSDVVDDNGVQTLCIQRAK